MNNKNNIENLTFSNFPIKIFVNIKEKCVKIHFFEFISNFLFFLNSILIIDIIFNYKRNFLSYHYPIYLINPTFYYETFLNYLVKNSSLNSINSNIELTTFEMNETRYGDDQISLIIKKYFKINIYEPLVFNELLLTRIIIILIIIFLFLIQLRPKENKINNFIKKICSIIIYFIFEPFIIIFFLIFNRPIIEKIGDIYKEIKNTYLLDFALMLIFNCISYLYYSYFIFSYGFNHNIYFFHNGFFPVIWTLNFMSSVLIILRYNILNSIIFQLFWNLLFLLETYHQWESFFYDNKRIKIKKISIFFNLLSLSFLFVRFLSLFLISSLGQYKIFKIFELLEIFLFSLALYYRINKTENILKISKYSDNLLQQNKKFFLESVAFFQYLNEFFFAQSPMSKITEKSKEKLLKDYEKDIKTQYCSNSKDFEFICDGNEKLKSYLDLGAHKNTKALTSFSAPSVISDFRNITYVFNLLINILGKFSKVIRNSQNTDFYSYAKEIIVYNKVLLFFIKDGKAFRSRFLLTKYLGDKYKKKLNYISSSILSFLSSYFKQFEKRAEDSSMMFIIIFHQLNLNYYQILSSFKEVLKSFDNNNKKEILYTIDLQSDLIELSLINIMKLNEVYSDSLKNYQPDKEKYKLLEDLIFNNSIDKSFDYFDINYLDSMIEKNTYFLIIIEQSNLIIKKVPLLFELKTGIPTKEISNKSFDILFPKLIRKKIIKRIKKLLNSNQSFKCDSLLEMSNKLIIGIKFVINRLPILNGSLYFSCSIEEKDETEENNYIIIDKEGTVLKFGIFFRDHFGFSDNILKTNIFSLFGIKKIKIEKGNSGELKISSKTLIKNIKEYLNKYAEKKLEEKEKIIQKLKNDFCSEKRIEVSYKCENTYPSKKNEELYLLLFSFITLNEKIIKKKKIGETQDPLMTQGIGFSNSASSVMSIKELKDINNEKWNLTNKKSETFNRKEGTLERFSFLYNLVLIVLALLLCIYIKYISNKFYSQRVDYEEIRQLHFEFLEALFFSINAIQINGDEAMANSLNYEYNEIFPQFKLELSDFYYYCFSQLSEDIFKTYRELKNLYSKFNKNSFFYSKTHSMEFPFFLENGELIYKSYINYFEIPLNNYYLISRENYYYINISCVFGDFDSMTSQNELSKKLSFLVSNGIIFAHQISQINYYDKENFRREYKKYFLFIYFIYFGFLFCNLISIVLLFFIVKISSLKIKELTGNILKITLKEKKFLLEKIRYAKKIVYNEMKPSEVLKILKNDSQPKNSKKGEEDRINNNDDEDTYLLNPSKISQNVNYSFRIYRKVIGILIGLSSIFVIYTGIALPIIIDYQKKFNRKKTSSEDNDDLRDNLLIYYSYTRGLILLNRTIEDFNIPLSNYSIGIFSNFSNLRKNIREDNNKSANEYMDLVNSFKICELIYNESTYSNKKAIFEICNNDPIMLDRVGNMISGFVNELRIAYNSFIKSERNIKDIKFFFHSRTFQYFTLVSELIFFKLLTTVQMSYILPDFEKTINSLSTFLIAIFVIMVITEIFNYVLSALFILKKISLSVKNFDVMNKFFVKEKSQISNSIKK